MDVGMRAYHHRRVMKKGVAGLLAGILGTFVCLFGAGCSAEQEASVPGTSAAEQSKPVLSGESSRGNISLSAETSQETRLSGMVVILDPGHGFGDTGCPFPGSTLCERDLTPVLVSKIRAALEADGVTVLQTHDGSTYPSVSELDQLATSLSYDLDGYLSHLVSAYSGRDIAGQRDTVAAFKDGLTDNNLYGIFERSYYANLLSAQQPSSLYVSIHVNANSDSSEICGFDLYCCSDTPYAQKSYTVMQNLETALKSSFPQTTLRKTSYRWDDAFAVNKYPDMPSVLIESGYATNPTDAANLQNEEWQDAFARAVANGIEAFLLSA